MLLVEDRTRVASSIAFCVVSALFGYWLGFQNGRDQTMKTQMVEQHGAAESAHDLQAELRARQEARGEDEWGNPLPTTSPVTQGTARPDSE